MKWFFKTKGTKIDAHGIPTLSLTPEEKKELTVKLRERRITQDERDRLLFGHVKLMIDIVSKFATRAPSFKDDFFSIGLLALLEWLSKAADKMRDNEITPYLMSRVQCLVWRELTRSAVVYVPHRTMCDMRNRGETPPAFLIQTLDNVHIPDKRVTMVELQELLLLSVTTDFERQIIELRSEGLTDEKIGDLFGYSKMHIGKVRKKIKKRFLQLESCNA